MNYNWIKESMSSGTLSLYKHRLKEIRKHINTVSEDKSREMKKEQLRLLECLSFAKEQKKKLRDAFPRSRFRKSHFFFPHPRCYISFENCNSEYDMQLCLLQEVAAVVWRPKLYGMDIIACTNLIAGLNKYMNTDFQMCDIANFRLLLENPSDEAILDFISKHQRKIT